jgi:hypothetical protein
MTSENSKRQRGSNQLAERIVENSTAEMPATAPPGLSQYMAAMGRKGGQIGGKRRLVTMTPEARKKIAIKAAEARWKKSTS